MSNKYRLFGKIPVADILIVTLLAAVLVVGVWFIGQDAVQDQTGGEETEEVGQSYPVHMTLSVSGIAAENERLVEIGDELFYEEDGGAFGKITGVRSEPYYSIQTDENGRQIKTKIDGKVVLLLDIEGVGIDHTDGGIYISEERLHYSAEYSLCNEKYCWKMTVLHIEREGA